MKDFNERRECTYINEYREYEDEMDFFSDVLVECNKRNLKANYLFGVITIKTNFSSWRFKPTNGKIRLMHKDNSSYHRGFMNNFGSI